jgi:hypothetical protein
LVQGLAGLAADLVGKALRAEGVELLELLAAPWVEEVVVYLRAEGRLVLQVENIAVVGVPGEGADVKTEAAVAALVVKGVVDLTHCNRTGGRNWWCAVEEN